MRGSRSVTSWCQRRPPCQQAGPAVDLAPMVDQPATTAAAGIPRSTAGTGGCPPTVIFSPSRGTTEPRTNGTGRACVEEASVPTVKLARSSGVRNGRIVAGAAGEQTPGRLLHQRAATSRRHHSRPVARWAARWRGTGLRGLEHRERMPRVGVCRDRAELDGRNRAAASCSEIDGVPDRPVKCVPRPGQRPHAADRRIPPACGHVAVAAGIHAAAGS